MRTDLAEDPAVIHIAEVTGLDEDAVVGKLHRLWSWADSHTVDGNAAVTSSWIDRFLKVPKFSQVMIETGWLLVDGSAITIPKFERHNGASAKARCSLQKRVAKHRSNADVTVERNISRTLRREIHERDEHKCLYCGRKKGELAPHETERDGLMSLDHVIPKTRGGDETPDNLVTCCMTCNGRKLDRTPDEAGMPWPKDVTGKRYGTVTREEKRREEKKKEKKRKSSSLTKNGLGPLKKIRFMKDSK